MTTAPLPTRLRPSKDFWGRLHKLTPALTGPEAEHRCRKVVAAMSSDADECAETLRMLGLL